MKSEIRQWSPRAAEARVERVLACRRSWTASKSLAMVTLLCAGRGVSEAARAANVTREQALAHWEDLMPVSYRGGVDNQAYLLAALRNAAARQAT